MNVIKHQSLYLILIGVFLTLNWAQGSVAQGNYQTFFPLVHTYEPISIKEVRGIWVTRFDWTHFASATPAELDAVVDNIALARFNVIFFQIRGEADAYYTPALEPWARRLTGTLGADPGWDPLQRLIDRAHEKGIQVHAYLNVYPVWTGCDAPPTDTIPRHLYYNLLTAHGETDGKVNALQWDRGGNVLCSDYQRVSPASIYGQTHLLAVVSDLVERFDIDGIHLDHIRYANRNSSCDPVSESQFGGQCFSSAGYNDWQRKQINDTVRLIYERMKGLKPDLWLTAAVWPVYRDYWGWGASSGYDDFYQDSKSWVQNSIIDGISPMIYTGSPDCNQTYFWTRERWQTLVEDFQSDSNGRLIIPGIGTSFCTTNDFTEIEARIEMARSLGTAGHAIFSYGSLADKDYFDDLAGGPYLLPAVLPDLPFH